MRLSEYTDYTLRVLMYCAAHRDRLVTIGELAEQHGLSRNHLMKVVNDLAHRGLLETTRGRGGGLRLRAEPEQIRIGDVVRATETDFQVGAIATDEHSCRQRRPVAALAKRIFDAGKTMWQENLK